MSKSFNIAILCLKDFHIVVKCSFISMKKYNGENVSYYILQVFINFVKKQVEIVQEEQVTPSPRRSWLPGWSRTHALLDNITSEDSDVQLLLGRHESSDSLEFINDDNDDAMLQLDQSDGVCTCFITISILKCEKHFVCLL